jgi:general stress protein 26
LTEAEKFLLTLKDNFMWCILTTTDKLHPAPRVVNLHHIPEFGFLITTKTYYSKMEQIAKNPIGTISIYPGKGMDTAVAHVSLSVTKDQKVLDGAWDDYMLKLGYSGKTDEIYRVILIKVHSVRFGQDIYSGIPIDGSLYDHIG